MNYRYQKLGQVGKVSPCSVMVSVVGFPLLVGSFPWLVLPPRRSSSLPLSTHPLLHPYPRVLYTRWRNLFPCKMAGREHRPGSSTVCNYVKTMLIEIAQKNPFMARARAASPLLKGIRRSCSRSKGVFRCNEKNWRNYANAIMYAKWAECRLNLPESICAFHSFCFFSPLAISSRSASNVRTFRDTFRDSFNLFIRFMQILRRS